MSASSPRRNRRATISRLRTEMRKLGRRIRDLTQRQLRIARRYRNDEKLAQDAEFERLSAHKKQLGRKYRAIAERYDRLQEENE